ncbi:MAG: hypothetical protein MHMPM18_005238 [Marteilia pararefringens]
MTLLLKWVRNLLKKISSPSDLNFSRGWLYRFKQRNNLKSITLHGEARSVNPNNIEVARSSLKEKLKEYEKALIYNMDKTALFYEVPPSKTICSLNKKSGTVQSKKRVSLALCANADGSHKFPPLMIGVSKKPRCFKIF